MSIRPTSSPRNCWPASASSPARCSTPSASKPSDPRSPAPQRRGAGGAWQQALGEFIRSQRRLANLSLRDMAEKTNISNPYLSQIERGLHEPSVRVLKSIAQALNVSAETLLAQAGLLEADGEGEAATADTEAAIRADKRLTDQQKQALLTVYRSYVAENR